MTDTDTRLPDDAALDVLVVDLSKGLPCAEFSHKCREMSERGGCHCAISASALTALSGTDGRGEG